MRNIANNLFRWYYTKRFAQIERFIATPHEVQRNLLSELIQTTKHTEWGKKHGFSSIRTPEDFSRQVPIQDYDSLKPYIQRMMNGEEHILWDGQVRMFSKSSGTTNDKSKFIPVSQVNLKTSHIKGSWDTMTLLYKRKKDCKIFSGKNFVMAGSHQPYAPFPQTTFGDVSALMVKNMPKVARPFFEPDFDVILQPDWELKIKQMAQLAIRKDIADQIRMVGGVPTWTNVFFKHILEESGKENMLQVWKNFEVYIHGGVSIGPYREQLHRFLPSKSVTYWEVYNASEGYFATQYDVDEDDMLLLLDNGVYYEFLPMEEWNKETPQAVPLEGVEIGKNYAMIISTNAGLWRYNIGDTVTFTSLKPHKIKITGRTQQFINAFGEELMVANADKALERTCQRTRCSISEYTAAPVYIKGNNNGGHEWLVEFDEAPADLEKFADILDKNLQEINSDYEAKRYKNMALNRLLLRPLPKGTFLNWLRAIGKYGNQHKVPRLSNDRLYIDRILEFVAKGS